MKKGGVAGDYSRGGGFKSQPLHFSPNPAHFLRKVASERTRKIGKERGDMTVLPEAEKYKFSPRHWSLPGYHSALQALIVCSFLANA